MIATAEDTNAVEDFEAAFLAGIVELAAIWSPDAMGALLGQAMELAALEGREAVFVEADEGAGFAEPEFTRQSFAEQIDFLTQKRPTPTRTWTDWRYGQHDRGFVVAGATDIAMLEEFQAAIIDGARTYDAGGFAREFDRIVEKYGWSYNGGREWRIRTIFETNIRTSYMAGRLRQMRDPDLVKTRPYWQYLHADTRVPLNPRPQHVLWDGMVLMWDDPWWNVYYPPNDWLCSCGCRTLSQRQLERLGKTGPDTAPPITRRPYTHKATGETVQLPEGTGYGWDYMPGDQWERGLVPSALMRDENAVVGTGRHRVLIDSPRPVEELVANARPFQAQQLPAGLSDEDYVRAFLEPFGATIDHAVLWSDSAGMRIPISADYFRARNGAWKVRKRGREVLTPLMAEALRDPDEIWMGVTAQIDPRFPDHEDLVLDRRYIRVDPVSGLLVVLEMGRRWWDPVTIYMPTTKSGLPDLRALDLRRGGKLLWSRS